VVLNSQRPLLPVNHLRRAEDTGDNAASGNGTRNDDTLVPGRILADDRDLPTALIRLHVRPPRGWMGYHKLTFCYWSEKPAGVVNPVRILPRSSSPVRDSWPSTIPLRREQIRRTCHRPTPARLFGGPARHKGRPSRRGLA